MPKKKDNIPALLKKYIDSENIIEYLDKDDVNKIGYKVIRLTKDDDNTMAEWRKNMKEALKIAKQVIEPKSWPWPNASNVKYPLILSACIQFNARTNPEIVQGDKVVNIAVMNPDPNDEQQKRAERLSQHMSYQLLEEVDNWKSDTDKLLMVLPMLGVVFRKSYYDPLNKQPQIDFCIPDEIIINNYISSLDKAERITHVLQLSKNDFIERMRAGLYTKYTMEELMLSEEDDNDEADEQKENNNKKGLTYEQHTFLDLDEDGYKEPYIVTVHVLSQKVLRIKARYDEDSFKFDTNGSEFIKIIPIQYFTDYHFITSPDGTYWSLGFGQILYPINAAINSVLNQLIDAGTLANRQSGFVSKSLKIRAQDLKFAPGEWKQIDAIGANLQDAIYPLPVKEPSGVLMELLQLLISAGKELGAITDVLLGESPGANVPATTVMALVEQGTKVYSSMLYRLYNSFKKEFNKLYEINKKYLDVEQTYIFAQQVGMITLEDYQAEEYGIFPVADPSLSSNAMKLAQVQALMQQLNNPQVDAHEILKRYLEILKVPNLKKVLPDPDPNPPPSPEDIMMQAKISDQHVQTSLRILGSYHDRADLALKEQRNYIDAAYKGSLVTSDKITAVSGLAQTEAKVGAQNLANAEKAANLMNIAIGVPPELQQQIDALQQQMGQITSSATGGQGQQQQQPGAGAQQGSPMAPQQGDDTGAGQQQAPGGDGGEQQAAPPEGMPTQ